MVEVTKIRDADMEDLFDPLFYLKLVNTVYANELPRELTMKAISGPSPRIAQRIHSFFAKENVCGGQFDPYRPAAYLLSKHLEFRSELDEETIERASIDVQPRQLSPFGEWERQRNVPLHQRRRQRSQGWGQQFRLVLRQFASENGLTRMTTRRPRASRRAR